MPSLSKWKVVFVTDRTQLEQQLSETSQSIGFTVKVADSIKMLKELLALRFLRSGHGDDSQVSRSGPERDLPGTEC